jgi:hypothetical protein
MYNGCDLHALFGGNQEIGIREGRPRRGKGENMRSWPKHPVIYEINTWVWLGEMSKKYARPVTLATIPTEEWDTGSPSPESDQP